MIRAALRVRQPRHRLGDQLVTLAQIFARAAVESHPSTIFAGADPEAVVLDLMQPDRPDGTASMPREPVQYLSGNYSGFRSF
jgi:hypothetical protein